MTYAPFARGTTGVRTINPRANLKLGAVESEPIRQYIAYDPRVIDHNAAFYSVWQDGVAAWSPHPIQVESFHAEHHAKRIGLLQGIAA